MFERFVAVLLLWLLFIIGVLLAILVVLREVRDGLSAIVRMCRRKEVSGDEVQSDLQDS